MFARKSSASITVVVRGSSDFIGDPSTAFSVSSCLSVLSVFVPSYSEWDLHSLNN